MGLNLYDFYEQIKDILCWTHFIKFNVNIYIGTYLYIHMCIDIFQNHKNANWHNKGISLKVMYLYLSIKLPFFFFVSNNVYVQKGIRI